MKIKLEKNSFKMSLFAFLFSKRKKCSIFKMVHNVFGRLQRKRKLLFWYHLIQWHNYPVRGILWERFWGKKGFIKCDAIRHRYLHEAYICSSNYIPCTNYCWRQWEKRTLIRHFTFAAESALHIHTNCLVINQCIHYLSLIRVLNEWMTPN